MCMAWHGMLSKRVGSMHACKDYVCAQVLSRMLCIHVVLYVEKVCVT